MYVWLSILECYEWKTRMIVEWIIEYPGKPCSEWPSSQWNWMINDEWWMMSDKWWIMNDKWWMMNDEWWMYTNEDAKDFDNKLPFSIFIWNLTIQWPSQTDEIVCQSTMITSEFPMGILHLTVKTI